MKTTILTRIVGLALCLSLTQTASANPTPSMESRLTYRRYTIQDGLPQMQSERLWQDSRGYIYIGTLSGFVRFDGRAFTPFLKGRRLNIVGFAEVDDEVRALGFFRQWRLDYDETVPMPLDPQGHWLLNNLNASSLPNGYVLLEDSLEQHRRLCRMTPQGMEPLLADSLLDEMTPDRKLYLDPSTGEVAIPSPSGLYLFKKNARQARKLSARDDIYTLLRTEAGLLAFASDGIYTVGKDSLSRRVAAHWQEVSYGLTVRRLRNGALVVADEHTVWLCEGQAVSPIMTGVNLIRDVLVDRWDRLWVATYQGVYCLFNRCFTNHRLTAESDIVRAVATDGCGNLLMGSLNGQLLHRDASGQVTLVSHDPAQFYAPSAVTIGGRAFMPANGDIACITTEGGKPAQRFLGLKPDRYQFVGEAWGKLITANRTSIFAYDLASARLDTLTTGILHPWCSATDDRGLLWIGSSSGLYYINKVREVQKMTYRDQKLIITTMEADRHGNVFFASADSLFVVRAGEGDPQQRVEALNTLLPQLCGHEIRSVHVSPRGYLVVAAIDGLFVCRIDERCRLSGLQFFNHLNGFTLMEPLKTVMAESADGTVWLPGIEQMASFRPAELLAMGEEDTFISPPLRWWQHWWVWLLAVAMLSTAVWAVARWYEARRNRRRMIRLQREKLQREEQIEAIRRKAIEEMKASRLAKDIVKMTEQSFEQRITLRTATGTIVTDVKDIAYFKADGNYSRLFTFSGSSTVLHGLGALEKMLSPEVFVRADRSTLVNIHLVASLQPRQRRCVFRSPSGQEIATTLLAPAFKRLQELL